MFFFFSFLFRPTAKQLLKHEFFKKAKVKKNSPQIDFDMYEHILEKRTNWKKIKATIFIGLEWHCKVDIPIYNILYTVLLF